MQQEPIQEENCPCRRKNCPRHGRCGECRAFHEKNSRYPVWCQREKKKVQKENQE